MNKEKLDALVREFEKTSVPAGDHDRPGQLAKAKLDVEIAMGLSDDILALRDVTTTLIESSRRLEGLTRWLVILTIVLIILTGTLAYDVVRHLIGN